MQKKPFSIYKHDVYTFDSIFFLDPNLELELSYDYMHSHNVFEIGYVNKGNGTVSIESDIMPYNSGDLTIVFPGDMHISNSSISSKSTWSYILIDADKLITKNPMVVSLISDIQSKNLMLSGVFSKSKNPAVYKNTIKLFDELKNKKPFFNEYCEHLFANILIEVTREAIKNNKISSEYKKESYESIIPAITYISNHYNENITSEQLANICYISQTHLRRIFKATTGLSPLEYLYYIRINVAKSLLNSKKMSVTKIAYEVGYSSPTSFNKHFKRIEGITPLKYQNSN